MNHVFTYPLITGTAPPSGHTCFVHSILRLMILVVNVGVGDGQKGIEDRKNHDGTMLLWIIGVIPEMLPLALASFCILP